ncbi:CGNR zinc finger domain-containing protein [Aeromicrobium sp. Sec7.5]|uniref:CGNR zinc finger domain-containing protein n=1 Tax=Aeromicrobium sp. Sec7.5 TaxID=3121276 RepID=UPI002FE440F9
MQFDVPRDAAEVRPSLVLVNSVVAAPDERDALAEVASAAAWFVAVAATSARGELGDDLAVDGERMDALREMRGAVEQILLARPRASSLAVVNRHETESAPSWGLDLDGRGELHVRRRLWGPGVESWLGIVAADCIDLVRRGGRDRIATCATPGCRIVLVPDHHRQRYCSSVCAHRTRQARYQRTRLRADGSA